MTAVPRLNDALTPREESVLARIVAGDSSKQMARTLGITHRTVEQYRAFIRVKLGARNTADMVRIAMMRRAHAVNLARDEE